MALVLCFILDGKGGCVGWATMACPRASWVPVLFRVYFPKRSIASLAIQVPLPSLSDSPSRLQDFNIVYELRIHVFGAWIFHIWPTGKGTPPVRTPSFPLRHSPHHALCPCIRFVRGRMTRSSHRQTATSSDWHSCWQTASTSCK